MHFCPWPFLLLWSLLFAFSLSSRLERLVELLGDCSPHRRDAAGGHPGLTSPRSVSSFLRMLASSHLPAIDVMVTGQSPRPGQQRAATGKSCSSRLFLPSPYPGPVLCHLPHLLTAAGRAEFLSLGHMARGWERDLATLSHIGGLWHTRPLATGSSHTGLRKRVHLSYLCPPCEMIEIISSIFSDSNGVKLEISNGKKMETFTRR